MPEISRFLGIVIMMFAPDHNPPHVHVRYGDYEVLINLTDGEVKGTMPKHILKTVFRWMEMHEDELMENWNLLRERKEPKKIEPLKQP